MAHWKRLTDTDGDQIDVNMDAVAYLQEFKDHTAIHFAGGLSAEGKAMIAGVREKPDTIHLANPRVMRSPSFVTHRVAIQPRVMRSPSFVTHRGGNTFQIHASRYTANVRFWG
jgi:hypothetical protein